MWKCTHCGEQLEDQFDDCWHCGTSRDGTPPPHPEEFQPKTTDSTRGNGGFEAAVGFVIGGVIAYLLRPSVMGEQLPFGTVITRGADLRGLALAAKPLAETSFNYLLVGAILGAFVGYFVLRPFLSRNSDTDSADQLKQLERLTALRKEGALTENEFQAEKKRILGNRNA